MGCNSGLFLKMAEDMGFDRVVGVDSDTKAVERGIKWKDEHGGNYKIIESPMEKCIDDLPLADYTVLANSHYYFTINDWLDYLDKLQYKTRYCIIVTAEKNHGNRCWAHADLVSIRRYFKTWEEVGFIDELPLKGDPSPRKLWGLCFKSPFLERVPIDSLDSSNHVQDSFYKELDEGKDFHNTRYYRIIEKYRRNVWSKERLESWFNDRVSLYEDVKKNGVKKPTLVDLDQRILDGNHKYSMQKNMGCTSLIIRRT
jgi:hypothetical protein